MLVSEKHFDRRVRLLLLRLNECEDYKCDSEYCHCNVKDSVHVRDCSLLGNGTDKRTHEHRCKRTHEGVECTSDLNKLVAPVSTASEKVEHRVYDSVEDTN